MHARIYAWGGSVIVCVLLFTAVVWYFIIQGKIRSADAPSSATPAIASEESATSTASTRFVPRFYDGQLVSPTEAVATPWMIMIDNLSVARPASGLAQASVVIEAPVEGGVTRFMALYAPTTTISEIGPVRSARPYFLDWAEGWQANFAHVGGSPEALRRLSREKKMFDLDEMRYGTSAFWRSRQRLAPHHVYTSGKLLTQAISSGRAASSTLSMGWHFSSATTSTTAGRTLVSEISIPYGGAYSVIWKYEAKKKRYIREQGKRAARDRDGQELMADNVIVVKTEARVLDKVGRLAIRTIGSGEAMLYQEGRARIIRWQRSVGEPIQWTSSEGGEILLVPGQTWIQVTTDDRIFAGLAVEE